MLYGSCVDGRLFDLEISASQSCTQRVLDLSKLAFLLPRLRRNQSFAGFGKGEAVSCALVSPIGADRCIFGMRLLDLPDNLAPSGKTRLGIAVRWTMAVLDAGIAADQLDDEKYTAAVRNRPVIPKALKRRGTGCFS